MNGGESAEALRTFYFGLTGEIDETATNAGKYRESI
jgi:hypothetical protein